MSAIRNNLLFFCLAIFAAPALARAASGITGFVFTTDPQTVAAGARSGPLTIQAQDANYAETKTPETIDLEFSSTSATGKFVNASSSAVSTVMNKNTANRTFYYLDSAPGAYTLTVRLIGRDSGASWAASQAISVSGAAVPPPSAPPAAPLSVQAPLPPPAPQPAPQSSASGSSATSRISADAGPDQTVVAGSTANFKGAAYGLKKEPLESARFWWNFGDGETQEGQATTHIFRIPGAYIVGLHVSSGEYEASDYATVHVLANQIRASRVIAGGEGYIQLANPLNMETDIGGWIIEDGSHGRFFIPPRTKISAGGEISFANSVTGLLQSEPPYPLALQYPNGVTALVYAPEIIAAPSAPSSTPARLNPLPAGTSTAGAVRRVSRGLKQKGEPEHQAGLTAPAGQSNAKNSAAVGFSVSSRMLFAGAMGLSMLGAIGFFVLKRFLI